MSRDIDRLINSQAMKIANDFQRQQNVALEAVSRIAEIQANKIHEQHIRLAQQLLNIPWSPLFKALERASTTYGQAISQTFRIVDSIQKNERLWVEVAKSPLARALQEIHRSHERLIESISLPALMAVSDRITKYIDTNLPGATFPETFAGQVLEALHGIYESSDTESAERNASIVEGLFQEKQEKISPGLISREGLIQILIALIICAYQMREGAKTEDRVTGLILGMQATIVERLEQKRSEDTPKRKLEIYYIVQRRPANLLSQPKAKGTVIGRLYPNQTISLIKEKSKWIYVQYFDYIDGVPKSGWVLKKYLRRAAANTGPGLTDFATLSEKADQILARHDTILLTSDEYKFFLNALADDRKPSKRSRAAAKRYRRGHRKGVRYHVGN
jgi:uncharacterized protein (DUF1778 family)